MVVKSTRAILPDQGMNLTRPQLGIDAVQDLDLAEGLVTRRRDGAGAVEASPTPQSLSERMQVSMKHSPFNSAGNPRRRQMACHRLQGLRRLSMRSPLNILRDDS